MNEIQSHKGAGSTVKEWVKKPQVIIALMLFLVITLSFGLGYLYAKQENPAPILIQKVVR